MAQVEPVGWPASFAKPARPLSGPSTSAPSGRAATALELIGAGRLIAILRGDFAANLDRVADTLATAGVLALEITMNSPGALKGIERLAQRLTPGVAIGVGTVRTPEQVARAADAGAMFVVSAEWDLAVIVATRRHGLASIPGAFTPTEIAKAIEAGADAVKLFPAVSLGPTFVHALKGPSPHVRLVPTGGIDRKNAADWLAAGAWAVGVGGDLVQPGKDQDGLRARAEAFVTLCRTAGR